MSAIASWVHTFGKPQILRCREVLFVDWSHLAVIICERNDLVFRKCGIKDNSAILVPESLVGKLSAPVAKDDSRY